MRKPVIDIETLQVYPSLYNCAKMLNVTPPAVFNAIILNYKCKGHRFEYFEEWQHWSSGEKEQHTRKNNIYFI